MVKITATRRGIDDSIPPKSTSCSESPESTMRRGPVPTYHQHYYLSLLFLLRFVFVVYVFGCPERSSGSPTPVRRVCDSRL